MPQTALILDRPVAATSTALLTIDNLQVSFALGDQTYTAIDQVSLAVHPGEILAVIGESGAGKSLTGAAVIGLLPSPGRVTAGTIQLGHERIDNLKQSQLARLRGKRIGAVFQDPLTSLNPLLTIGRQLIETIRTHLSLDATAARNRAVQLLAEVGIPQPEARLSAYPHQFSGGQRQRVAIALALAGEPELIIADEPTSALDVSVQAQIIALLRQLADQRGVAILLITHDMGVVAEIADRAIVMHEGKVVSSGSARDVIHAPDHPYTRKLVDAIPTLDGPGRPDADLTEPFVIVDELTCDFEIGNRSLRQMIDPQSRNILRAVDGVSFTIDKGRTIALVGESGSGKSTIARIVAGLIPATSGRVDFANPRRPGQVQMIFQDPFGSLNPRWRVGDIIAEPIHRLGLATNRRQVNQQVADLLDHVRLDASAAGKFPHEFSGGQRQRIAIARALASRPEFLICDEPTSALDVSVQAQVLDLMLGLQAQFGLTYLLISHNLAVVKRMADCVGVLHRGRLVEQGDVSEVFANPRDPYTRALIAAVPRI